MKLKFLLMAPLAVVMMACGGQTNKEGETSDVMAGSENVENTQDSVSVRSLVAIDSLAGEWKIVEISGVDSLPAESKMVFDLESNHFGANVGCNSIGGEIDRKARRADYIAFNNVACTQMACPDMKAEDVLNALLPKVTTFFGEPDGVVLTDDEDIVRIKLAR